VFFFRGWLFAVGWMFSCRGKKRRNRGREGRWQGHLLIISDGIADGIYSFVNPLVMLSVN